MKAEGLRAEAGPEKEQRAESSRLQWVFDRQRKVSAWKGEVHMTKAVAVLRGCPMEGFVKHDK